MGNSCAGSFARVETAEELRQRWIPDTIYTTYDGEKTGQQVINAHVTRRIAQRLRGLTILNVLYFFIGVIICGLAASLIPGYAQIPDPTGTGFRVPHSVWFLWSGITVLMFMTSFYFGPYMQLERLDSYTRVYFGFLVIDILQTIFHLIFTIIEVVEQTTGLASNTTTPYGFAFLITLIVFLAILFIFAIIIAVIANKYSAVIDQGALAGWRPGQVSSQIEANKTLLDSSGTSLGDDEITLMLDQPQTTNSNIKNTRKKSNAFSVANMLTHQNRNKDKRR